MGGWSDTELAAAVDAYRDMARRQAAGQPYSKREVYRAPQTQFGRTEGAFEYRMQNISAVLQEIGEDWLPGLKPAGNVGSNIKERIRSLLAALRRAAPSKFKSQFRMGPRPAGGQPRQLSTTEIQRSRGMQSSAPATADANAVANSALRRMPVAITWKHITSCR